jgi:hypothetical protein
MSFAISFVLFLVIFLVINLVAAVPGRATVREITRAGLRHFVVGTVIVVVSCVVLYFLMNWLISLPPLW